MKWDMETTLWDLFVELGGIERIRDMYGSECGVDVDDLIDKMEADLSKKYAKDYRNTLSFLD